jgi:general secretion pathway protein A
MYEQFFGLTTCPFKLNPDPRFLFHNAQTREALSCLLYVVQQRRGVVLLTGEVGTGKTTLLNSALQELQVKGVKTAYVFNPRLDVLDFLKYIMTDLDIPIVGHTKGDLLGALNNWLLHEFQQKRTVALVIDEAHEISDEMLEEVRLLTNLETSQDKLIQIVLSGQPELESRLRAPHLRQLRQRITLWSRTRPMTFGESEQYIRERLLIAGHDGSSVFTEQALSAIFRYARGIPRTTNLLCDHALIASYAAQTKLVHAVTIEEVARDFELDLVAPILTDLAEKNEVFQKKTANWCKQ